MKILSEKQLIGLLDELNQESFKYVGVVHIREGFRPEVESHRTFLNDLKSKPIMEIMIKNPPDEIDREFHDISIIIHFHAYVNIYRVNEVRNKLKGISKNKCLVRIQYGG